MQRDGARLLEHVRIAVTRSSERIALLTDALRAAGLAVVGAATANAAKARGLGPTVVHTRFAAIAIVDV